MLGFDGGKNQVKVSRQKRRAWSTVGTLPSIFADCLPRFDVQSEPRAAQVREEVEYLLDAGRAVLADNRKDGKGDAVLPQDVDPSDNTIKRRPPTSVQAMSVRRPRPVDAYSDSHAVPLEDVAPLASDQCRTGLHFVLDTSSHAKRFEGL